MPERSASTAGAPAVRKSTNLRFQQARWKVPIVDRHRRLGGWMTVNPEIFRGTLRHAEAERLVGGRVIAVYVQIADAATATVAGAPPGWTEPWRCVGLCAESARPLQNASGQVPTIELQT